MDEDLSRLQSKYTGELPKGGKDPDEEVADKCWELHKKRNDSVIQDIFGGQVKSTVRSPPPLSSLIPCGTPCGTPPAEPNS